MKKIIWPVSFGWRWHGKDTECHSGYYGRYQLLWSSNQTKTSGMTWMEARRSSMLQIYAAQWLMAIIDWPARQWRLAKHRYYYGRLEYQYQAGRAEGLREGLLNREAYFDMTSEELAASTGMIKEDCDDLLSIERRAHYDTPGLIARHSQKLLRKRVAV